MGSSLALLLSFVTLNLPYFEHCDERLGPILLKNIMQMVTSHSQNVVKEVLKILNYLMKENSQSIVITLVKNYFNQILINLQFQSIPIKIQLLEVVKLICINPEIVDYLVKEKDLEQVMVKLIIHCKEGELVNQLTKLTWQIMNLSQDKHGKRALQALEQYHMYRTGEAGDLILKLVDLKK